MSIVRKFVNNFTTGEISPGVQQRLDLQKYAAACQRIENAVVLPHGGVAKRHGLQCCAFDPYFNEDGLLVPFQYAVGDAAVLLFTDKRLQIFVHGERVTTQTFTRDGETVVGIATPYKLSDLAELRFVQSGDVMFFAHHDYQPRKLTRSISVVNGNTVVQWTLETLSFAVGIMSPNTPSAADNGSGGQIATIVAANSNLSSKDIFYKVSAVDDNGEESLPSKELKVRIKPSWPSGGEITVSWSMPSAFTGTVAYYNVYKKVRGQYGKIGSTESTSIKDDNVDPDLSFAPKSDYQPFGSSDGGSALPGCVSIYQQRLVFARTDDQRQTVFMTETGIWNSFGKHEPLIDSDSIEVTMDSRMMNEIRHVVLLKNGIIFTSGAEYVMSPGRNNDAVTPTSIRFDLQSYWGSSHVPPLVIGNNVLFVLRDGRVVRDFMYNYSEDGYTGSDLTIMANHLLTSPIRDWAYQQSPNGCIWVVLEDGTLLSFTYMKEQEIYAWARHNSFGAKFRSVTVVNEGGKDIVYFLVEREGVNWMSPIEDNVIYSLERMDQDWEYGSSIEDSVFLDASVFYEFDEPTDYIDDELLLPLTYISKYLYDKMVQEYYPEEEPDEQQHEELFFRGLTAVIDGSVYSNLCVDASSERSIHLPVAGRKIIIGLPYKMTVETVDPEISSQDGAIIADKRSVAEVAVAVRETADLKIGYDEQHLETLKFPYPANLGDAPVLYTGYLKAPLAGSYRPTASMVMTSDSPLPCTILSVMSKISIG